jgi:hypothetical protein
MDRIYDSGERALSLKTRFEIAIHLVFCSRCTNEAAWYDASLRLMKTAFFPPAPSFEDAIMERIADESPGISYEFTDSAMDVQDDTESSLGISLRGWVVTGLIILFSLVGVCYGIDFANVAASQGSSFLLPLGITIGAVVTGYGALFIASHLKEFSSRFRLH